MSDFLTITNLTGGDVGTAPNVFAASTNDPLATIVASGYVSDLSTSNLLKNNDSIFINYDIDGTSGSGVFRVYVNNKVGTLISQYNSAAINGLTAHAGGGQGSALQLSVGINRITAVATAADSVKLPAALVGSQVVVANATGTNSMNVFPQTGEFINALTANTALAVGPGKTAVFFCAVAGSWNATLSA